MLRAVPACAAAAVLLIALLLSAACTSPQTGFSTQNAQAHIRMLAGTIGSRPTGSDANRRAREYIVSQLRASGFDVQVQEADAVRPLRGTTIRVANVIATRPGRFDEAIALVSHYDSVPDGPGASDDGLAVAVCLEAGRVLAERNTPTHTLALVFTDGEELGLMGATALMKHPVARSLGAVLNFESIGSGGPDLLFESDIPGERLITAWAQSAPRPAGASYAVEIYKRLPNDTDFTVFQRAGIPGLNFAVVGDGYSYHTARDTPARVDPVALQQRGENAIALVRALDRTTELSARDRRPLTYFDVLGTGAFAYRWPTGLILFAAAALLALFGWLTVLPVARRTAGPAELLLTVAWTLVAGAAVFGAMWAAGWLLRATRESYHPWYAHPDRFFLFLALAGILGGRTVVRLGRMLPRRVRGSTHAAVAWVVTLPFWLAVAIGAQIAVPTASYLAVIPLLAAGVALVACPLRRVAGLRIASAIVLAVGGTLWIPHAMLLLHFAVPTLGRLPIVTPLFVYPALLMLPGLFVVPPFLAVIAGGDQTAADATARKGRIDEMPVLLAAVALAAAWCWFTPAYTHERPLHASIAYVDDAGAGAHWHIASNEPGAGVELSGPVVGGWRPGPAPRNVDVPLPLSPGPFEFHGLSTVSQATPATATGSITRDGDSAVVEIKVVPELAGLGVAISLPPGVVLEESNLAVSRAGRQSRYTARYAPLPAEGVTFRARILAEDGEKAESSAAGTIVTIAAPGVPGAEWPKLPGWLPQDHVVWQARSYFTVPVRFPEMTHGQ